MTLSESTSINKGQISVVIHRHVIDALALRTTTCLFIL